MRNPPKLKRWLPLFSLAVVLLTGRFAWATLTVHDLAQDLSTGVFTYTVQLDSAADLQPGDGFVLYDFPGEFSWSISGGLSTAQFTLAQTLTSNTLTQSSSVDANGDVAAISNGLTFDDPTIENLSFAYVGPPNPFLGVTTAILTVTSTVLGGETTSVYASVDHSGSSQAHPYSYSANPINVPAPIPEPASATCLAGVAGLFAARRRPRSVRQ
jgi:hypothetical protein